MSNGIPINMYPLFKIQDVPSGQMGVSCDGNLFFTEAGTSGIIQVTDVASGRFYVLPGTSGGNMTGWENLGAQARIYQTLSFGWPSIGWIRSNGVSTVKAYGTIDDFWLMLPNTNFTEAYTSYIEDLTVSGYASYSAVVPLVRYVRGVPYQMLNFGFQDSTLGGMRGFGETKVGLVGVDCPVGFQSGVMTGVGVADLLYKQITSSSEPGLVQQGAATFAGATSLPQTFKWSAYNYMDADSGDGTTNCAYLQAMGINFVSDLFIDFQTGTSLGSCQPISFGLAEDLLTMANAAYNKTLGDTNNPIIFIPTAIPVTGQLPLYASAATWELGTDTSALPPQWANPFVCVYSVGANLFIPNGGDGVGFRGGEGIYLNPKTPSNPNVLDPFLYTNLYFPAQNPQYLFAGASGGTYGVYNDNAGGVWLAIGGVIEQILGTCGNFAWNIPVPVSSS